MREQGDGVRYLDAELGARQTVALFGSLSCFMPICFVLLKSFVVCCCELYALFIFIFVNLCDLF